MKLSVSRNEFVEKLREKVGQTRDRQRSHLQDYCFEKLQGRVGRDLSENDVKVLRSTVSIFCTKYFQALDKIKKPDLFFKNNAVWLCGEIDFEVEDKVSKKIETLGGRPSLSFSESAPRTQRTKAQKLGKDHCADELLKSAETLLRKAGNEAGAKLISFLMNNPDKSTEMWMKIKSPPPHIEKLTPEEAVSLIIDADLSKNQYNLIRSAAKTHSANIFPSYFKVQEQKTKSLPPHDKVIITETSAEVDLQTLVDMDAKKIVTVLEREGKTITDFDGNFILTHKWGSDGSGDHSLHRHNTGGGVPVERSVFLTAQVPLQLKFIPSNETAACTEILWMNSSPSSTRFCKPIRIQHKKEDKDTVIEEERYYQEKSSHLVESEVQLQNGNIMKISHCFKCTMIDGKTRTYLTKASSQSACPACGAKPVQMSDRSRRVNINTFKYGISVLHCRIRFLECVLHISYRLEIKVWSCNQSLYSDRKKRIQEEVRKELGLLVDMVQHGSGSTNDGNTARKFFENTQTIADITGFDKELLDRFHTIQTALNCTSDIDPEKFRTYCLQTADRYDMLYPWYYMPQSVHFILIHGADVMTHMDFPMGYFSEEALEGSNKYVRSFREYHTRKNSLENTMEDLFYRLLLNGDVLYSSIRNCNPKVHRELPLSVLELLQNPS